MAFVLEKISEEDMKKYKLDSRLNSSGSRKNWVIDRERGIFLIKIGKPAMGFGTYELHYLNDGVVGFDAEELSGQVAGNPINNPKFSLSYLRVPSNLTSKIDMVKSDVRDALNVFGYFADPEWREGEAKIIFPVN